MDEELRVATDPVYYEEHSESVEFWSPGNPEFNAQDLMTTTQHHALDTTLKRILDHSTGDSA